MENELFTLENLGSRTVTKRKPWDLDFEVPEFRNSNEYKTWAAQRSTKYLAYSTAEGINPDQRISSENPVRYLHGVCADWDATFDDKEYEDIVRRLLDCEFPVNYISRSYSKGYIMG